MELLDEMVERELREEVKGMEGNTLYIGPRVGTMKRRHQRNSVNETTHTTQKLTRGIFGRQDELRKSTNDFATHGS